jgi:hypothetical protein
MRNKAKAAVEQAGTARRHAHAAQERVNALTKQKLKENAEKGASYCDGASD